ncbi:unnamed protein product [Rhizophagus irregularis]|nr:unnamed protein product [Rhizophagus irregularis]
MLNLTINQYQTSLIVKFVYPDSAGKSVNIFIFDSGILLTHEQFMVMDVLFVEIEKEMLYIVTFVASIAAGNSVEVARNGTIIDVRVLDANGDDNMSLRVVRALNHVVKEVTDAGIHIAVSAGNDSKNAC